MASAPVGYLLTWTCYGTWLHGDGRGSVDREHHTPGEAFLPLNPPRRAEQYGKLRHLPVQLDAAGRKFTEDTIVRHCQIRRWTLHAYAVRTNHAHVVVSCDIHPDRARDQFKAYCTRELRARGVFPPDAEIWTEGGSDRWLWDAESLAKAIRYVGEQQGEPLN